MRALPSLIITIIILCLFISSLTVEGSNGVSRVQKDALAWFLDSTEKLMTGKDEFDRELYSKLKTCMNSVGSNTVDAQNMIWRGLLDYWNINGVAGDRWGSRDNGYHEKNYTIVPALNGMKIAEPCNSASNVAYHHTLLELCHVRNARKLNCLSNSVEPILRSLAYLMPSSYFHHASSTHLGIALDLKIIDVISYLLLQASLSGIPYDPVIHELSDTSRKESAIAIANRIEHMYKYQKVTQWNSFMKTLDVPSRYLSIGAFLATTLVFSLDSWIVRIIAPIMGRNFNLPEEEYDFLINTYLPKIIAVKPKLGRSERKILLKDSVTTMMKFGYAFLWMSNVATEASRGAFGSFLNIIGSRATKLINFKLNLINSYSYNNRNFQYALDIFPGGKRCSDLYPHTKWHVMSAISIVDAIRLGNTICQITSR